jgi:hypothetical protein
MASWLSLPSQAQPWSGFKHVEGWLPKKFGALTLFSMTFRTIPAPTIAVYFGFMLLNAFFYPFTIPITDMNSGNLHCSIITSRTRIDNFCGRCFDR